MVFLKELFDQVNFEKKVSKRHLTCRISKDAKIHKTVDAKVDLFVYLFDSLHPLNNLSVMRDGSSWVEPVLSYR